MGPEQELVLINNPDSLEMSSWILISLFSLDEVERKPKVTLCKSFLQVIFKVKCAAEFNKYK